MLESLPGQIQGRQKEPPGRSERETGWEEDGQSSEAGRPALAEVEGKNEGTSHLLRVTVSNWPVGTGSNTSVLQLASLTPEDLPGTGTTLSRGAHQWQKLP